MNIKDVFRVDFVVLTTPFTFYLLKNVGSYAKHSAFSNFWRKRWGICPLVDPLRTFFSRRMIFKKYMLYHFIVVFNLTEMTFSDCQIHVVLYNLYYGDTSIGILCPVE
jgi:hypothetical protein